MHLAEVWLQEPRTPNSPAPKTEGESDPKGYALRVLINGLPRNPALARFHLGGRPSKPYFSGSWTNLMP